jgi:hypothetical protein
VVWEAGGEIPPPTRLDGIIELDTERGKLLGFTSEKYDGYLWKIGDAIMVSFIVSRQRGNFRELVRRIHALGLAVKVPTPLGRMQEILIKNEYQHTVEYDAGMGGNVDVWLLKPSNDKVSGGAKTSDERKP